MCTVKEPFSDYRGAGTEEAQEPLAFRVEWIFIV